MSGIGGQKSSLGGAAVERTARIAYLWTPDDITVEIDEAEGAETIFVIGTPAGVLIIQADIRLHGDVLVADGVHIQGLSPGRLGRAGLNAVGRKMLEESGARALVVQGGPRSTGRNPGRPPRPFRFPR